MSRNRTIPRERRIASTKGPDGRRYCRWCNQPVKPPRRSFCSDACVHEWNLRSSPGYLRHFVFERDKGICAECGLDTEALRRQVQRVKSEDSGVEPAAEGGVGVSFTFGSLFAGIGGLDLGLERAGWTCRWQVEIDDYCRRVLERHWPSVKRYEDVRDVGAHNLEPVSLICGGFPCQPVSLAGKGLAQRDERWLWPEFARVVRELRPRFVLVENVPGLLVRGMGDVLGSLAALGYDAEWQVLPAATFGAPHLRKRVFIVAYTERSRLQGCTRNRHAKPGWAGVIFAGRPERVRGQWELEPDVGRVAHGLSHRVERLRALGNAVVPQVAEWIGRRIRAVAEEGAA